MTTKQSKAWFAPKRYGYGAGLPIAWQGWVVLAAYLVVCCGAPLVLMAMLTPEMATLAIVGVILIATVALLIVCARTTEGGWRWRWGKDD